MLHNLVGDVSDSSSRNGSDAGRPQSLVESTDTLLGGDARHAVEGILIQDGVSIDPLHLQAFAYDIQRVRRGLRRSPRHGPDSERHNDGQGHGNLLPGGLVHLAPAARQKRLHGDLGRFVNHEFDADVRKHGNERGTEPGVESLGPYLGEDAPKGGADASVLAGVHGEHGLDDLDGVHHGRGDHARKAARDEPLDGIQSNVLVVRNAEARPFVLHEHPLELLKGEKLDSPCRRDLEAVRAVPLEESLEALGPEELRQLPDQALVAPPHHLGRRHHLERRHGRAGYDARHGPREEELGRLGGAPPFLGSREDGVAVGREHGCDAHHFERFGVEDCRFGRGGRGRGGCGGGGSSSRDEALAVGLL